MEYTGDLYFNAKTIREYAEIILICAVELEHIAVKTKKKKGEKHGNVNRNTGGADHNRRTTVGDNKDTCGGSHT